MAHFRINLSNVRRAENELRTAIDRLERIVEEIESVSGSQTLREGSSFNQVRAKLRKSRSGMLSTEQKAESLRSALLDVANIYEKTERKLLGMDAKHSNIGRVLSGATGAITNALKETIGFKPGGVFSSDPVNLSTGNYVLEKHLMMQEGLAAFEVRLFYNSMNPSAGIFGKGWTSNLEIALEYISETELHLHAYDAAVNPFVQVEEGIFYAARGDAGSILRIDNGWIYLDSEHQFVFDINGRLTLSTDHNGNGTTFLYDESGRIEELQSGTGERLQCIWREEQLHSITNQKDKKVEFTYENTSLSTITDEMGAVTQYRYDSQGFLNGITNALGVECLVNEFDQNGRVVCQHFPDGGKQKYEYDDENNQVIFTQQNGSRIIYTHDERYNNIHTRFSDGVEVSEYNTENRKVLFRNKRGGETKYHYDAAGRMTMLQNAVGDRLEIAYNANHKPTEMFLNHEKVLDAAYDKNGNPLSYQDKDGRSERYEYNAYGEISCLHQADGSCLKAEYDDHGNMTALTGAMGNRELFEYDAHNRVCAFVDGNGNRTELEYYKDNRIRLVRNATGAERIYTYNACGNLVSVKDFDGTEISFQYNELNQPSSYKDQNGNVTQYLYNQMWDLTQRVEPNGAVTRYEYDEFQQVVGIVDALGNRTTCKRDENGNIIERTSASGDIFRIEYDMMDRPVRVVRPDGTVLTAEYDALGRITEMADAAGGVTRYEYDFNGNLLAETDPSGYRQERVFDKMNNLLVLRDRMGILLQKEYYPGGLLKKEINADGSFVEYAYDANQNVCRCTNQDGFWREYEYDCLNRPITMRTESGITEKYEYDAVDNLISVTDGEGNTTRYTYSPTGKILSMTDPLGNKTFYEYDCMDWLVSVQQPETGNSGIQKIIEQNQQKWRKVSVVRDVMGNVVSQRNALSQEMQYFYNAENLLSKIIDEDGGTTEFTYDYDGQISHILYADGKQVAMQYSPLRHLQEMQDALGTTAFIRDSVGRITSVVAPEGTVDYEYNERGQRTVLRYPDGTETIYKYHENGQLLSMKIGEDSVNYGYYPNGRLREKTFPNGAVNQYSYKTDGMLAAFRQIIPQKGEVLQELMYNHCGQKSSICSHTAGKKTLLEYVYTPLGNLESVKKNGELLQKYTYDAFGNCIMKWDSGEETRNCYNVGDQLTESESKEGLRTYVYDGRGNMVEERLNGEVLRQFSFGSDNLMQKAVSQKGSAAYQYNGMRQRVRQSSFDIQGNLISDIRLFFDAGAGVSGNILQREDLLGHHNYLWDSELLGQWDEKEYTICQNDMLGSPIWINGSNGYFERQYDSFGFGIETDQFAFGFAAYLPDPISGTSYAYNREYDSRLGRFTSRDPVPQRIFSLKGMNVYLYCDNDPQNKVDRDGRIWVQLAAGIVGAVAKVTKKVISNAIQGKETTWQDVLGSAVGGFVGGVVKTVPGLGSTTAGALSNAVETLVTGVANNLSGSENQTSWGELLWSTTKSGITGAFEGYAFGKLPDWIKIPGVTSGKGHMGAVWQQIVTKAGKGIIRNVTGKTLFKGLTYQTLAATYSGIKSGIKSRLKTRGKELLTGMADSIFGWNRNTPYIPGYLAGVVTGSIGAACPIAG